jgi:hypothetical protein
MEYVRSSLPVIVNQFSPPDAGHLLYLTGKLVGMQFYPDIAASFPATHDSGPQGFSAHSCSGCTPKAARRGQQSKQWLRHNLTSNGD